MRVADGFFCGFTDDWRASKVPDRLLEKLLENYRDYFDEAGNMIPGREENFEAFVYFVDRILTSVNSKVNDYGPKIRKAVAMSSVYSISDEAFALITLENYYTRWVRMLQAPTLKMDSDGESVDRDVVHLDKTTQRTAKWFAAKYTASQRGKQITGWNKEGIARHLELARLVKGCRLDDRMGQQLEAKMVKFWIGRETGESGRAPQQVVEQYTDNDLFGGDVEEI